MFGLPRRSIGLIAAGGLLAAGTVALVTTTPVVSPSPTQAATATRPAWSQTSLKQLLDIVESARDEGLRPSDYQRDALAAIVASGRSGAEVDALAAAAGRALGHDFAAGRVPERRRIDWHIEPSPAPLVTLDVDLDKAVQADRVGDYLRGLLPQDARYAALRDALRAAPETDQEDRARIAAIRASLERWRWMPRVLGPDYLLVNVPAYQVTLFAAGQPVATHDVIVGAPKTPTPQLSASVDSIVVNPWWTLPPAVLAEGKHYSAAKGYVYVKVEGGTRIRQRPGPNNALGRIKINMPNPYAIYLHDTPGKAAFLRTNRALSHGCVRVKDVQRFAERIGDATAIEAALDTDDTRTIDLQKSLPVYIAYFTAAPDADGKVAILPDPYDRDAGVIAALDASPVDASPARKPSAPQAAIDSGP